MLSLVYNLSLPTKIGLGLFVCYVVSCRRLRYLRRDYRYAQSPYKTRDDFKKMTAEDAWAIVQYVQALEFPWMTTKALSFALFRWEFTAFSLYAMLTSLQNVRNTFNLEAAL